MNKQHQLWGADLSGPAPWHRFHTKSQQIEADKSGVNTGASTMLPLCIHQACQEKEREGENEAEGRRGGGVLENEKSHIMVRGFIFTESKIAQFEHLRWSELAGVRGRRHI